MATAMRAVLWNSKGKPKSILPYLRYTFFGMKFEPIAALCEIGRLHTGAKYISPRHF